LGELKRGASLPLEKTLKGGQGGKERLTLNKMGGGIRELKRV
jgi:hypothetical protein